MRHYGNWRVDMLIVVAAIGLMLLLSEGKSAEATILIKSAGLMIGIGAYKAAGYLYRKGKLGNIDEVEE